MIKDASTTPLPIMPDMPLDKLFLPKPLIKKPINGNTGINQTNSKILLIRFKCVAPLTNYAALRLRVDMGCQFFNRFKKFISTECVFL